MNAAAILVSIEFLARLLDQRKLLSTTLLFSKYFSFVDAVYKLHAEI